MHVTHASGISLAIDNIDVMRDSSLNATRHAEVEAISRLVECAAQPRAADAACADAGCSAVWFEAEQLSCCQVHVTVT